MNTRHAIFGALLAAAAFNAPAARADQLNIFGTLDPLADVGMSGTIGGEFTKDYPGQTFLVGVEFRGFSSADRRTRYFWVSGSATFNEGVVYENADHNPQALYVDINLTPVTTAISQTGTGSGGHEAREIRIAPLEFKRDLRWGTDEEISVRAFGLAGDVEKPLLKDNPHLRGFLQAAVDLVGLRYLSQATYNGNPVWPGTPEGRGGVDFGAVKAKAGLDWDLSSAIALRVSVGVNADMADLWGAGHDGLSGVVASGDAFGRIEFIFKHLFTRWSLFAEAGERGRWEQDESAFVQAYGYIRVGLQGSYY